MDSAVEAVARAALLSAGLADVAEFKLGNARSIAALSGSIDFVLVDLWKDLYIPCFELFYPKLGSGAMVVADNMIFPEFIPQGRPRTTAGTCARRPTDLQSVLLPVGSGSN